MGRVSLGSFLMAMFILGFYVFAHWQMAAEAQKLNDLVKLQEKIIDGIEVPPPQPEGHFWADLRRTGVVDDEDAQILKKYGYEYVPVGPDSPPDAVLFRQRQKNGFEKHVYANGKTGYEHRWISPDGKHALCDVRNPAGGAGRLVQFVTQPGGQPIGEFPIDRYESTVIWNGTGELAVMHTSLMGRKDPFTVWHVGGNRAEPIPLPAELSLESLLARETKFTGVSFGISINEPKRWLSAHELFVLAEGAGTYTNPATQKKMGFHFTYHVVLDVQPGQCRVQSAKKQHFSASVCKSCK